MPKFEFDATVVAPTLADAKQKISALNTIGSHLTLQELQALAETVQNPTALAVARQRLGL